jgi:HPt (histidine-containing phosphotransfer) domain-containing protein
MMYNTINYASLKHLEDEVAAGIPEIMIDLIRIYIRDCHKVFPLISAAIDAGNIRDVELSAHSLKASCGTFGAEDLASVFAEMEHLAHHKKMAPIASLLDEAVLQFADVEKALEVEIARLAQDSTSISS